jgi:hypothetical protein
MEDDGSARSQPVAASKNAVTEAEPSAAERFVREVARLQHSGDDGFTHSDDPDDAFWALDRLIARARDVLSEPLRQVLSEALARSEAEGFVTRVASVELSDMDLDYLVTNTLYAQGSTARQVRRDGAVAIRTLQAILRDAKALGPSAADTAERIVPAREGSKP